LSRISFRNKTDQFTTYEDIEIYKYYSDSYRGRVDEVRSLIID